MNIKSDTSANAGNSIENITNLSDLLRSRFYDSFRGDKLGNDLFINDPDRAERIQEYAQDGADGSTHAEAIEDMRECNELAERGIYRTQFLNLGFGADCAAMLAATLKEYIDGDIDEVESRHDVAGSLDNIIG